MLRQMFLKKSVEHWAVQWMTLWNLFQIRRDKEMGKRIPWDKYEAAILVEAYYLIANAQFDRHIAVQVISDELRRKALNAGMDIDAVFRNTNGINMRLYEIQFIVSPEKGGMKNTSKLFKDTVKMYFDQPDGFAKLLQEAKGMIDEKGEKTDEFLSWIKKNKSDNEKSLLETTMRIVNVFGRKASLFSETLEIVQDLEKVEKIKTQIVDENIFKFQKKKIYNFKILFDVYEEFLTTYDREIEGAQVPCSKEKTMETDCSCSEENDFFDHLEDIIKDADINGITAENVAVQTGKSIWSVKKNLKKKQYAIEIPGNLYIHVDNIIDIFENEETIQKILQNQFIKFAGYTNDTVLYDAATISLGLFLNDNCIDSPAKMYGIARYLFEKKEKRYFFGADKHIWEKRPEYPVTNPGVLMGYINKSGLKVSKTQCIDYLQKVKLASRNINGLLSMASNKTVLFYGDREYVMAQKIIEDDAWLEKLRSAIKKLFENSVYVIPREIKASWFELLPDLAGGLTWNLLMLQDLIKKYLPEYRLITANEDQGLETIRAGIVMRESTIEDFANLVYARILEDSSISLPIRLDKEDFRQRLIGYKMIQGNELIYTMPKALDDSKYAWSDDGESVLILKK